MRRSRIAITAVLLVGCSHISLHSPENFRKMVACKEKADEDREHHRQSVEECLPLADAFVASQETYKLDQDEQLEAFNAVYGIYFYAPDRGGKALEEIFSRFEDENRTQKMAENVYDAYMKVHEYAQAKAFAAANRKFKLVPPPRGK